MKRFIPFCLAFCFASLGAGPPTQEDVFRSIQSNMKASGNSAITAAIVLTSVMFSLLLLLVAHRRQRQQTPQTLNHSGRLLREVASSLELKPQEVKRLKELASTVQTRDGIQLKSPLTLLLCPSLLNPPPKKK